MLKVVIIDDESSAREVIIQLLQQKQSQLTIVGEADSVERGIALINSTKPDLVMLDINLKDGTGFDLLRSLDQIKFKIIFITAYDRFALNAIKFSALDYLLKPIDADELDRAIERALSTIETENLNIKLNAFFNNFKHLGLESRKIVLHTNNSVYLLNVKDIVRCAAESNQTRFYLTNGEQIIAAKSLREFDNLLEDYNFIRVHKTHLVNVDFIERFDKINKSLLVLKDKSIVPVAIRRKAALLSRLQNL
ncbi:MAG: LytTR family DNA-binding domain-containing protein [Bacteroidetes bacterium]|nr:LytTR family DNA-binding domain-containing protein [Bacteroidota bacterium]